MSKISVTFLIVYLCLRLTSCINLSRDTIIEQPYFVSSDPAGSFNTLYYNLGNGNAIERVRNVKRVGHTDKFIIAEVEDGYYFIDKKNDTKFLNSEEIIGKLSTPKYFLSWLDSMKITNFEFDYYEGK
jgi:hypothetical protein